MSNKVIESELTDDQDEFWLEQWNEEWVKQAERFDDFAKELIKVELAIMGVYIAVLKLGFGKTAIVMTGMDRCFNIVTFVSWFLALYFTSSGLFPSSYDVLKEVPSEIKKFYKNAAVSKRKALKKALIAFSFGIIFALVSILY